MASPNDLESSRLSSEKEVGHGVPRSEVAGEGPLKASSWRGILKVLETRGDVELRGCTPVSYEDRTETNYFNIFTLWFCMSCNPLPWVLCAVWQWRTLTVDLVSPSVWLAR
jgi:hypothetical protein